MAVKFVVKPGAKKKASSKMQTSSVFSKVEHDQEVIFDLWLWAGVSTSAISSLKECGVSVSMGAKSFIFRADWWKTPIVGTVELSAQVMGLVKAKDLSSTSKHFLRQKLETEIKSVIGLYKGATKQGLSESKQSTPEPEAKPYGKVKVPEGLLFSAKETATQGSKVLKEPTTDLAKLSDAKELLQPVCGTDSGSVYHVVALSEGVKVAARYIGGKLSIRVEGKGLAAVESGLIAAGLSVSSQGHYSGHFKCENNAIANKTLGASLFAIGIDFGESVNNIKAILGKGV